MTDVDLVVDDMTNTIFEGTPDQVEKWLKGGPPHRFQAEKARQRRQFRVFIGQNSDIVSADDYLLEQQTKRITKHVMDALRQQADEGWIDAPLLLLKLSLKTAEKIVKEFQ